MTSIDAAKLEVSGQAEFHIVGRKIRLMHNGLIAREWNCRDETEAKSHLRLFRSSVKYVK